MATKIPKAPVSIGRQLNFTTARMNALCQSLLAPHGLSLSQWVILSCLWRDGELSVGALAELNGAGLPATSRIVDRMVERGLVERRRDGADGRVSLVQVTRAGRALDHLAGFHETVNAVLFAGFTTAEQEQAFALLRRMELNAKAGAQ